MLVALLYIAVFSVKAASLTYPICVSCNYTTDPCDLLSKVNQIAEYHSSSTPHTEFNYGCAVAYVEDQLTNTTYLTVFNNPTRLNTITSPQYEYFLPKCFSMNYTVINVNNTLSSVKIDPVFSKVFSHSGSSGAKYTEGYTFLKKYFPLLDLHACNPAPSSSTTYSLMGTIELYKPPFVLPAETISWNSVYLPDAAYFPVYQAELKTPPPTPNPSVYAYIGNMSVYPCNVSTKPYIWWDRVQQSIGEQTNDALVAMNTSLNAAEAQLASTTANLNATLNARVSQLELQVNVTIKQQLSTLNASLSHATALNANLSNELAIANVLIGELRQNLSSVIQQLAYLNKSIEVAEVNNDNAKELVSHAHDLVDDTKSSISGLRVQVIMAVIVSVLGFIVQVGGKMERLVKLLRKNRKDPDKQPLLECESSLNNVVEE